MNLKKVYAHDETIYFFNDNPQDVLTRITAVIDSVPTEYKDTTKVDLETDCEYGEYRACLRVYYYRPETREEKEFRMKRESAATIAREASEKALLARLQSKYGDCK